MGGGGWPVLARERSFPRLFMNTSPGVGQSSPTGPVAGGAVGGSGLLGEM